MNYSSYPNLSPFNSTSPPQKPSTASMFSGLSSVFTGKNNDKDTLPFSYADPTHTKTTSTPSGSKGTSSGSGTWLPSFLSNASPLLSGGSPSSLATSTPLTATQEWLETLGMTRTQRYTAFAICAGAAVFLFFLAMLHLPFVVIRPGKFVVPYCMGSMFILVSFGFIHGFVSYWRHLLSPKKVAYSAWFILATFGTLYSALSLKSYLLTVIMSLIQMAGMITFIVSYVPGGSSGISFMSSMISSSIKSRFAPNSF